MAAVAALGQDVDIDPGWYQGQPETAQPPTTGMPTVLTKLQKWGDYQGWGSPVWPTKLIPMKTPLSADILANWHLPSPPRYRLTVADLLADQAAAGRRIGLILDLSNHDCLYAGDLPPGIAYVHVQLVAKELPPLAYVREVGRAATAFWAAHPDDFIAIHCAYGFNRTGFVVCSFLVECCGLSVDQALASFAASRPPGVKHKKFIDELQARYGGANATVPRSIDGGGCAALAAAAGGSSNHMSTSPLQQLAASSGSSSCTSRYSTTTAAEANEQQQQQHLRDQAAPGAAVSSSTSNSSSSTVLAFGGSTSCPSEGGRVPPLAHLAAAAAGSAAEQQQLLLHRSGSSSGGGAFWQRPPVPVQPSAAASGGRSSPAPAAAAVAAAAALTPTSSRAVLGNSPLPRLLHCYSSGSVGDNSSIGCSPDSAPDVMLQASSIQSTNSSSTPLARSQGSSAGPIQQQQEQQPLDGFWPSRTNGSCSREQAASDAAAAGAAELDNSSSSQQASCCPADAGVAAPAGEGQSPAHEPPAATPGCWAGGHAEPEHDDDDDSAAAATATEEDADCFLMDDEAAGEGAAWGSSSQQRRSSECCCSSEGGCGAAASGCCRLPVPEAADISGLLAAVQLGQQAGGQPAAQQQQVQPIKCACAATLGSSGRHRLAASSSGDSGAVTAAGAAGGVGAQELANESFGRVNGDDLLRHLRDLRKGYEDS